MERRPARRRPDLTQADSLFQIKAASVMRGDRMILDDVSLTIPIGQSTVILGRNGSGKSTLVKLMTKQIHPLGGSGVHVLGHEHWDVFELRKRLGIVSSSLQADFATEQPVRVMDAVLSGFFASHGLWRHHAVTSAMRDAALDALTRLDAAHLAPRQMDTLSTGEARRVLIARALVNSPVALLLDEPCAGLDPATRRQFLESLRSLIVGGMTLVLVTHHIEEILPEISHVVMIDEGRIIGDGPRADLLTDAHVSDLFGMPARLMIHQGWTSLTLR